MSAREAIGVDLGGTKMLVGVVGEGADVLHRNLATSRGLSEEQIVELLERELRDALEAHPGVVAIGLGVPCTIDRGSGVCVSAVNLPLADLPLRQMIAERLGLPTSLDNDATLALLAEHRAGAARGLQTAAMLTIGTGIGGGVLVDGAPFRGAHGAGGELGHIVIDANGPPCQGNCPNRGCVESVASGTALAREGRRAAQHNPDSALGRALWAKEEIDGGLIAAAAHAGDEVATDVLALIGRRLGVALSSIANALDPELLILGGGVMEAGAPILEPAREEVRRRALPPQSSVPVELAAFGSEAGLVGAALLALEELDAPGGPV